MYDCVLLVSGSRDFNDKERFDREFWKYIKSCAKTRKIKSKKKVLVVVGDARGTDSLALDFCKSNGIPYKKFKADWDKYGNGAGPIRNQEMCDYKHKPTNAFFVWDRKSKGTLDCMGRVSKLRIPNATLYFEPNPSKEELAKTMFQLLRKHSAPYTEDQINNNGKIRRKINRKVLEETKDIYENLSNAQIKKALSLLN